MGFLWGAERKNPCVVQTTYTGGTASCCCGRLSPDRAQPCEDSFRRPHHDCPHAAARGECTHYRLSSSTIDTRRDLSSAGIVALWTRPPESSHIGDIWNERSHVNGETKKNQFRKHRVAEYCLPNNINVSQYWKHTPLQWRSRNLTE
jgi:hypothetical protein